MARIELQHLLEGIQRLAPVAGFPVGLGNVQVGLQVLVVLEVLLEQVDRFAVFAAGEGLHAAVEQLADQLLAFRAAASGEALGEGAERLAKLLLAEVGLADVEPGLAVAGFKLEVLDEEVDRLGEAAVLQRVGAAAEQGLGEYRQRVLVLRRQIEGLAAVGDGVLPVALGGSNCEVVGKLRSVYNLCSIADQAV